MKNIIADARLAALCLTAAFFLLFHPGLESQARDQGFQGTFQSQGEPTPLLPFLDYYIDETFTLDIEEVASPGRAQSFKPLDMEKLPRVEGMAWFRFTISALAPEARPATFLLDMGQSVPGTPLLYTPERNELSGAWEWQENTPSQRNILLLPESGNEPITCYIRLEGLPGPWFSPMIRTPQNAASNWGSLSRTAAILSLAVVMALCFLRGMSENGQWRIWTALYVGVALAQAILGMPVLDGKTSLAPLAAILSPGIALMLLPHVGRHLMRSRAISRPIDIQLLLLSLPGAFFAILPLLPGWDWLDRWLDLWPLGAFLFVPTALGAWISGIGGARRFLLGSIIPPCFAGLSWLGLDFGFPPYLLASGPIWGVALSALMLATISSRWDHGDQEESDTENSHPREQTLVPRSDGIILLEHPLDDPNLRLIPADSDGNATPQTMANPEPQGEEKRCAAVSGNQDCVDSSIESAMIASIDDILRQGSLLGQCSLPPAAREHAEKMINAAKQLAGVFNGETIDRGKTDSNDVITDINLQRALREAHDSVATFAENSGTSLSWHMPPHLESDYRGKGEQLNQVLHLLLESAIRASPRGMARLSVRRVPESDDPGQILFTVADNGHGLPPENRSCMAVMKAWRLAAENGGYFGMESGKTGTAITFSMRLSPISGENRQIGPHVIIAGENEEERRELADILKDLPCRISEAANAHEVLVRQSIDPAPLLIATGRLALPAAADMVHEFAALARQAGFAKSYALAITEDDSDWSLLKPSGFTHAMNLPIDADSLRNTTMALANPVLDAPRPASNLDDIQSVRQKSASDVKMGISTNHPGHKTSIQNNSDPVPDLFDDHQQDPLSDGDKLADNGDNANPPLAGGTTAGRTGLGNQDPVIAETVESPDWLDNSRAATSHRPDSKTHPASSSEPPSAQVKHVIPSKASEGKYEWVGDPVPVSPGVAHSAPQSQKASPEQESRPRPLFPEPDEWVGEPRPVEKKSTEPIPPIRKNAVPDNLPADAPSSANTEPVNMPGRIGNAHNATGESRPEAIETPAVGDLNPVQPGSAELDPVILKLVDQLDEAMNEASGAFAGGNTKAVAAATTRISQYAENFGLRLLSRMALCVTRAAQANDMTAIRDLLPDLANAVERNRLTLTQPKKQR